MKNDEIIPMDDPRWEEAVKAMSDDEFAAYMQHVYTVISADRESFGFVPDELLESIKSGREDFIQKVLKCKIAEAEAAAAKAQVDRAADKLLANLDDRGKKGN